VDVNKIPVTNYKQLSWRHRQYCTAATTWLCACNSRILTQSEMEINSAVECDNRKMSGTVEFNQQQPDASHAASQICQGVAVPTSCPMRRNSMYNAVQRFVEFAN